MEWMPGRRWLVALYDGQLALPKERANGDLLVAKLPDGRTIWRIVTGTEHVATVDGSTPPAGWTVGEPPS